MTKKTGIALALALLIVVAGCGPKKPKAVTLADPKSPDVSFIQARPAYELSAYDEKDEGITKVTLFALGGSGALDLTDVRFDGQAAEWTGVTVAAVSPGKHTVSGTAGYGKEPFETTIVIEPSRYYILYLGLATGGNSRKLPFFDVTEFVNRGGPAYEGFRDAEKTMGLTRLARVETLRAKTEKNETNFGVYDVNKPSNELSTVRIVQGITVTQFDAAPVFWNGPAVVRIPYGNHTLRSTVRYVDNSVWKRIAKFVMGFFDDEGAFTDWLIKDTVAAQEGIAVSYDFYGGAQYKLDGAKDKTRKGNVYTVALVPGKGAPKAQKKALASAASLPANAARKAAVISNTANFRNGPSADAKVIKTLKKGDTLTVTGESAAGWLPVEHEGAAGFVSADLLSIEE